MLSGIETPSPLSRQVPAPVHPPPSPISPAAHPIAHPFTHCRRARRQVDEATGRRNVRAGHHCLCNGVAQAEAGISTDGCDGELRQKERRRTDRGRLGQPEAPTPKARRPSVEEDATGAGTGRAPPTSRAIRGR